MPNYLISVDADTKQLPQSVLDALPFSPKTIVDARVDGGNVWLIQDDGTEIPLGDLTGPAGPNTVPTQTAIETVLTAQKGATSGIVPMATGSDWSDATRKLHAEQSGRGASEVNVLVFGADPSGSADSTAAMNAAIDAATTFKIGAVFIPSGKYRIDGTIAVTSSVSLRGQYTGFSPSNGSRVSGTIIVAGTNANGDPVIEVKNSTAGGYLSGMSISDMFILGSASWTSDAGSKDRVALRLFKVISEYTISGLNITGFKRNGIDMREVWDGTIINTRIMYCGTAGTYPALNVASTPEGNTNSLHAFGLHVEHCPWMLDISGDSRHNMFTGCKFELGAPAPTTSPITIGASIENTFVGCYFVSRNADDPVYATATAQPHLITVNGPKAHVTFTDCMASVPGYSGTPLVDPESGTTSTYFGGARWLNVQAGIVQWNGGILNVWCGQGAVPIILSARSSFKGATINTGAKGGIRQLFTLDEECQVVGNVISPIDSARAVTIGYLFICTGARNIIGPNVIRGPVNLYMNASSQQTVARSSGDEFLVTAGATPNLGWVDRFATDQFVLAMAAVTNVTGFSGGWVGREVTIRFGNANTTLVHSGSFLLKGAVNANPPSNGFMKFKALSSTTWAELSRSF